MSNQTTSGISTKLFARKGTARPVGPGTFGDQARNDNEEAPPVPAKPKTGEPNAAASLFSIDFKRRTAGDEAVLAAIGAFESEVATEAQPAAIESPQKPFPSGQRMPASLIIILLVAVCLGVGIWYVFHQKSMMEDLSVAAGVAAPSESAGVVPEPLQDTKVETAPGTPPPAGDPTGEAVSGTLPPAPSFDLIRIEPNGEAVIAGRAPPHSELILLDNGKPIGTVTADWAGEWAFIPDQPLTPGNHEFSLVIMTPQGTVTVPAVVKPDNGALLAPADPAKAAARLKGGDYVVQLSSTTTMKGARQELSKIQRNFGDLLGSKKLSVQQAKLNQGSVRYRVRSDAFAGKDAARKFCAAFRAKRQECLVIKR